jgi:hypothetical protein
MNTSISCIQSISESLPHLFLARYTPHNPAIRTDHSRRADLVDSQWWTSASRRRRSEVSSSCVLLSSERAVVPSRDLRLYSAVAVSELGDASISSGRADRPQACREYVRVRDRPDRAPRSPSCRLSPGPVGQRLHAADVHVGGGVRDGEHSPDGGVLLILQIVSFRLADPFRYRR